MKNIFDFEYKGFHVFRIIVLIIFIYSLTCGYFIYNGEGLLFGIIVTTGILLLLVSWINFAKIIQDAIKVMKLTRLK